MSARKPRAAKSARRETEHATVTRIRPQEWPEAHVAYFEKRGIPLAWAEAAGCTPVSAEVAAKLAPRAAYGRSAIGFTFRDLDGGVIAFRKLHFAGQEADGFKPSKDQKHASKSWQEAGRAPPVFLAPPPPGDRRTWREVANDPSVPILFTESEVKAMAGALHGDWTIGATSCETWHESGDPERLVPVLRDIKFDGRKVFVALDSDVATNPNVRTADEKFRAVLARRRAEVVPLRIPAPTDGRKSRGLDDLLAEFGGDALRNLKGQAPQLPEVLSDGSALLDTKYPPLEFAIAPYLPRREVVEIHGAHGQFKSTLMLGACLSVATGERWGICDQVSQGTAAFISMEDRESTLQRRVRSYLKNPPRFGENHGRKEREAAVRANFKFLGRERAASLVMTEQQYGQTVVRRPVVDRIAKLCQGASLLVLETAARLHPGGETNEALAVFAGALEEIAERTGACVVLVRLVSKEVAKNGGVSSYGGRGGGALADAARSVLSVERRSEHPLDPVFLVHTKATHTARGPELAWKPVVGNGDVHLRAATPGDLALAAEAKVLDVIAAAGPAGIKQSDLAKRFDSGGKSRGERASGRAEFLKAIDTLVADGRVERVELKTGQRGPPSVVLRLPGAANGGEE